MHRFFRAHRPLLFAHRGGAALAPENTIAAFDRAAALGVDGLELDVRLAADGLAVVHHDAALDRTTNGRGPLGRLTSDELARLDAGCRFRASGSVRTEDGPAGVPTLAAVLARYPELRLIIEMKDDTVALAEAVVGEVRRASAVERVCLGAFGRRSLRAARALEPAIATGAAREEVRLALYRSWLGWPVRRPPFGGYQVPETSGATRVVSPRFVRHAHDADLAVQVWTVDDPDDARRLLSWGVDALISDRPDLLVPLVTAGGRSASGSGGGPAPEP